MSTLFTWGRIVFAALALAAFTPCAIASGRPTTTQTQTTSSARTRTTEAAEDRQEDRQPAGDPTLGVIIIIGIVGFLVVVAWIFSRTGDDGGRGPDRTLL